MVTVKRKFGTPVIATSDPDDLSAQELGSRLDRAQFISVVAAPEQIDAYLEELLSRKSEQSVVRETNGAAGFEGPSSGLDDTSTVELTPDDLAALVSEPVALVGEGGTDAEVEPLLHPAGSVSSPDIAPDDAAEVSAGSGITEEESAEGPKSKTVGVEPDAVDTATPDAEDGPIDSTKGSAVEAPPAGVGRHRVGARRGREAGRRAASPRRPAARHRPPRRMQPQTFLGSSRFPSPTTRRSVTRYRRDWTSTPPTQSTDWQLRRNTISQPTNRHLNYWTACRSSRRRSSETVPIGVDLPAVAIDAPEPPLGQAREDVLPFAGELEALALSVEEVPDDGASDSDDGTDAADMVAEAVATYHELHPEASAGSKNGDSAPASFPPLARPWWRGPRCRSTTWRKSSKSARAPVRPSPGS